MPEEVGSSSRRREEVIQYIIALPMMIPRLIADAQTLQVLWASPSAVQLLAYSEAEITHINLKNVLELNEPAIQQATQHPTTQNFPIRIGTGEPRLVRGVFIYHPDVQLYHFVFEDRTEWALAYRFITETAPTLVRLPDEQFLPEAVCKVANLFQVKYVYIGKLVDAETVQGLAFCVDGQIQPTFDYTLANTPCEQVFNRSTCFFASGVRQLFPLDKELEELEVESYLGTPLTDSTGRPMGIMWACDTRPMPNLPLFSQLFRLIADQVSVVLERERLRKEFQQVNEQLIQVQKMESIGQMAGGLAHDFNNMLTAVLGFIELAQSAAPADSSAQPYLERAIQAVDKASQLTRQLLTFARRQPMQIQPIDLNTLVQEALRVAQGWLPASIQLKVYADQPTWTIEADPTQLSQVIYNLVINARDAMPQGGTLTVETANVHLDAEYARTHFDVLPGDYVLLAISDTGIGMTPEVKSRIFDPFYTNKQNASGLGLTIVYSIVRQLGGYIWVYSEPNRGTTFKIYLPRARAQQAAEPIPQLPTQLDARGQEVILLVEDEADVRAVAAESLRRLGYQVLECANPAEALQTVQQHPTPIHLLVTDVVMPVMSGRALADHILRLQPQIKVLYVSGYTENIIAHHGVLEQGINFLPKPYTPSQLAQRVRQILDEKGD